jgi:hypothetical protein
MSDFEILDERFRSMVLSNAPLETLGEGYGWLEGPVWFADHDCLYVSDIPNDRILRWSERGGVSVFRHPAGFANGHARDREGRLLGCSHRDRCITRTELDGAVTVLASRYRGKRLNSPNDIVCKSDGTIWFSDPLYGISTDYEGGKQRSELPPAISPSSRTISTVPTGLHSRRTSACSTWPKRAVNSIASRASTSGASACMRAGACRAVSLFTRSRPALPMGCAWMIRVTSGRVPQTASIASALKATSSARS